MMTGGNIECDVEIVLARLGIFLVFPLVMENQQLVQAQPSNPTCDLQRGVALQQGFFFSQQSIASRQR
jgi:hypothetical protein